MIFCVLLVRFRGANWRFLFSLNLQAIRALARFFGRQVFWAVPFLDEHARRLSTDRPPLTWCARGWRIRDRPTFKAPSLVHPPTDQDLPQLAGLGSKVQ